MKNLEVGHITLIILAFNIIILNVIGFVNYSEFYFTSRENGGTNTSIFYSAFFVITCLVALIFLIEWLFKNWYRRPFK